MLVKNNDGYLYWKTIAVHVGCLSGKNYACILTDNVFLDFILPHLREIQEEYAGSKNEKSDPVKAKEYGKELK